MKTEKIKSRVYPGSRTPGVDFFIHQPVVELVEAPPLPWALDGRKRGGKTAGRRTKRRAA